MLKSREFFKGKSRGEVGGGNKFTFSLVVREQRSVAAGNKVMDTRLPQPAGCGDKYDVLGWCWERLFNTCYPFFKYPSPDAKASPSSSRGEGLHRPWCHKILGTDCASRPSMTGARGANSFGRSMIEMLGVLAIIGVLSVSGIAGYSKAMEMFKINKIISEYNMLILGLMEHKSEFPLVGDDPNGHYPLSDIILALNLVPETWKYINSEYLEDSFGNYIKPRSGVVSDTPQIVLDFNLGGLALDADGKQISSSFSEKLCFEMFNNVIYPLHSALVRAYLFRYGVGNVWYYGDSFCGGANKCISELTLSSIKEICSSCDGARRCNVTIAF